MQTYIYLFYNISPRTQKRAFPNVERIMLENKTIVSVGEISWLPY